MSKINNKGAYPIDTQLSLDDFLLGSNADRLDKTQNYLLRGIFSTFKTSLSLSSIEYIFAGGSNVELTEGDRGYFTTNGNNTLAGAITTIKINKEDLNSIDLGSIIQTIQGNLSSFMLTLFKPSSAGQIFYFQISSVVDSGSYYTLSVDNFVGGNSLVDETTYTLNFDLAGVPSTLTETDPIFTASVAHDITSLQVSNWDTAFGWGDHAAAGYQAGLGGTGIVKSTSGTISYLTDNSTNWNTAYGWGNHASAGYLTSETDPVFTASDAYDITALQISHWNTAYGWGNHASAGYLTSISETDPVFTASDAYDITNANKAEWSSAYHWGDHAAVGYLTSVDIADINTTGTADSTTYLRGDGVWDEVSTLISADIPVVLPSGHTLGKYSNGDTIPSAGMTVEELFRDIALAYVPPVFSSFSISGQSTSVEVGTTLSGSKTFTWGITLNSGTVPTIDIYDITAASTLLSATTNDGSQAQVITTKLLNSSGANQQWRAIGDDTTGSLFNSGIFKVTSYFYRFWGAVSSLPSGDGATNRTYALGLTKAFKTSGVNTFTLVTGTTETKMVVLLPPSVTITEVIDTTNLNANLTSDYILSTVTIKDAGGTDRTYNMYTLTVGSPYTVSANHVIKTT